MSSAPILLSLLDLLSHWVGWVYGTRATSGKGETSESIALIAWGPDSASPSHLQRRLGDELAPTLQRWAERVEVS